MNAVSEVQAIFAADRRLTILRLLDEARSAANTSVIEKALRAFKVPGVTRDTVNGDARYLAAAGLVLIDDLRPDLLGVTLTDRGERVARGEDRVDGIARPSRD